jgi:integrase
VKHGWLSVTQQKTGTSLRIPICPELQALLDRVSPDRLTFLVHSKGAPFSPRLFRKQFWLWCREAGIPDGYSFHGLRKACLRRLAEAGRDHLDLMVISGHMSADEVEHHIKAAEQARRAKRLYREQNLSQKPNRSFPRIKRHEVSMHRNQRVIAPE